MTDWELIKEQIDNAMKAVDRAHEAKESMEQTKSPQSVDQFTDRLQELCDQLSTLKSILNREGQVTMDEISDMLSKMLHGKPSPYRRTPRPEDVRSKETN